MSGRRVGVHCISCQCYYSSTFSPPPSPFLPVLLSWASEQALWEHSRSQCAHSAGVAVRCARMLRPLATYGLHYIRTAFQLKPERRHCCEMDYSQQQWVHFRSSNCSLARHTGFLPVFNLPLNRACCHGWPHLQHLYLSAESSVCAKVILWSERLDPERAAQTTKEIVPGVYLYSSDIHLSHERYVENNKNVLLLHHSLCCAVVTANGAQFISLRCMGD